MAKKIYEARITSKGQTTIPVEIREKLQVGPGDTIQFVLIDGQYQIIPRNRPAESLFGCLHEFAIPNTSVEDYRDAVGDYFATELDQRGDEDVAA